MASSVASTASPAPSPSEGKVLKGRDLINIGIFTAIYFVIQFVFMLCGGIHPALWVFMPALDGLFAGIPFMLMCAKVQKPGAVVIMGLIVALIYFATGMFTPLILAMMAASCVVAEVIRAVARYRSFLGNAVAYAVFGLGMCGSPLPLWVFEDLYRHDHNGTSPFDTYGTDWPVDEMASQLSRYFDDVTEELLIQEHQDIYDPASGALHYVKKF